jgi:hypothetical protein
MRLDQPGAVAAAPSPAAVVKTTGDGCLAGTDIDIDI